jgi:CysZ protein
MLFSITFRVLRQITTRPFRAVLLKSIGITLLVMLALGVTLYQLFDHLIMLSNSYIDTGSNILAGFFIIFGMLFLIVPTTTLVAGFFLDDIAKRVEEENYPHEPAGEELALFESMKTAVLFTGVIILANMLALFLLLVPGLNLIIFYLINGYLLGREYFDLAARRYRSASDAKMFRQQNLGRVYLGGLICSVLISIPIVNLLTPMFATAFMVHLHKQLSGSHPVEILVPER